MGERDVDRASSGTNKEREWFPSPFLLTPHILWRASEKEIVCARARRAMKLKVGMYERMKDMES
jgi:hypothetical protein